MKKNILIGIISIIVFIVGVTLIINNDDKNLKDIDNNKEEKQDENNENAKDNVLEAVVLTKDFNQITIQDNNNIIYTFSIVDENNRHVVKNIKE